MVKRLVPAAVAVFLLSMVSHVIAVGFVQVVTKENQAKLGLNYTLVAERVDSEAVLVSVEIPRTGTLKQLRSVSVRIGPGRPVDAAAVQTTLGKDGARVAALRVSPEVAAK